MMELVYGTKKSCRKEKTRTLELTGSTGTPLSSPFIIIIIIIIIIILFCHVFHFMFLFFAGIKKEKEVLGYGEGT